MKTMAGMTALLLLAGCASPSTTPILFVPMSSVFKEARPGGSAAGPALSNAWWTQFKDPELDVLESRLLAESPDLATSLARYRQARAALDTVRSAQSPTLGVSASAQREQAAGTRAGGAPPVSGVGVGLELEYEVDLWGRVRQQVAAGAAQERAAAADLGATRIALQAQLADTVMAVRGLDTEAAILRETAAAFTRAASLVERRHALGVASGLDLARAQAQADSTRSQLYQVEGERAVLEHAVAALIGVDPSAFTLTSSAPSGALSAIAPGVPSTLLLRRPDIVASQQRVRAAQAGAGVARTAFFPSLSLGASGGVQANRLAGLASLPNLYWALGTGFASQLLDGGRRRSQVAQADAALDESGSQYRAVVLAALQQVEDQLALLQRYGEAAHAEALASNAAARAATLAERR
jgi:NodT family efflux transporter outer membrane factor (OMF) lipoprotein